MIRKTFPLLIVATITFWFISFNVTSTNAQVGGSLLTSTPAITARPTHMPYDQQLFYGEQRLRTSLSTETSLDSPVRGTPGDWWADVVIGQPNFAQITPNQVVGNKLFNPGGAYVDRSTLPNKVYVYDAGNSRILGFSSLGACVAGSQMGQSCTSNSDCPGSSCAIDSHKVADLILGQPSPNSSACNGDSGFQNYPNLPAPTAATLCGLRPENVSILEGGSMATMASDSQGNLYHADIFNNRVLRYDSPFNHDSTADAVWGQANFIDRGCNEGRGYGQPDNNSLCLAPPVGHGSLKIGVAIDSVGNLWVSDIQNHRVLRFPYSAILGRPAQQADLVLGQTNFSSATWGTGLHQMIHPGSVRVDTSGKVYVLDGMDGWGSHGRLLVFNPPLSNGMAAGQVFNGLGEPNGLELDPDGALWINNSDQSKILRLINGQLQTAISGVVGHFGGFGIDRDRNVVLAGWDSQSARIYSAPGYSWTSTFLQADEHGSFNQLGPRGLNDPAGMEVTDDQLIVSDGGRILFWNQPSQLTNNYPPADGVIGQPDFFTRPRWDPPFGRMRADTHGRLWVVRANHGLPGKLFAYQLPLVSGAAPIIQITSPIPLLGGGSFSWTDSLVLSGLVYQPECDCLWLSDRDYNRVFRIRNISSGQRVVDIVLGQKRDPSTLEIGSQCNQGRDSGGGHPASPSQDSLCQPGPMAFDRRGNLFVSDHNLETSGNWRLLEFEAAALPLQPTTPVFAIPASRVYGRHGSFTEPNCPLDDPLCGPWEPVFYPNNDMVLGFNGYLGPHFPQVYHDPLTNALPYTALKDFYSHAYSARLDANNNLYVVDLTRSRVLIYKAASYTISGNLGLPGVTLSYTDDTPKTVTSQADGSYSFSVSSFWSGTITPSHPCFTFSPPSQSYSHVTSDRTSQDYTPIFNSAAGCTNISISIAGADQGSFVIPPKGSTRVNFAGLNSGPVKIFSTEDTSFVAAQQERYKVNGTDTSFSEMMGLPNNQLDRVYWLPWYNNKTMSTQLQIANVSASMATVRIFIGSVEMPGSPFTLAEGVSSRKDYPGINGGPVRIISNADIVASERVIYRVNGVDASYSEMMAVPQSKSDRVYWLPWYNNKTLSTQLQIANISGSMATIRVVIGGKLMNDSPFTLPPGRTKFLSYPGVDKGPVKIVSNVKIVAAQRVVYKVNNVPVSFAEMKGLPHSQVSNSYWLPWYNNKTMSTQLRIANVSASTATVHISIGGGEMPGSPLTLAPGTSIRKTYADIDKGPVKIESNFKIVVSERVIYRVNGVDTSFSELMGLPDRLLDSIYWLPWYSNVDNDTQLRLSVP